MLIGALLFTSCENDIELINLVGSPQTMPTESGMNVETIYSDSAKVKVKLISPQMDRYNDKEPRLEMPKGVHILFYDEQMKVKSELTADYAVRYEADKRMEAKGNVVVLNERGEKLNTEHLIWDQVSGKIRTEKFVKITTAEEVIYGDGLESNQDFTKYKILKPKGTISIHDSGEETEEKQK